MLSMHCTLLRHGLMLLDCRATVGRLSAMRRIPSPLQKREGFAHTIAEPRLPVCLLRAWEVTAYVEEAVDVCLAPFPPLQSS
jgi:hypothetical protein